MIRIKGWYQSFYFSKVLIIKSLTFMMKGKGV